MLKLFPNKKRPYWEYHQTNANVRKEIFPTVAKGPLVLKKHTHMQQANKETHTHHVYITPSTLLEAGNYGCILQVVHTRKGIRTHWDMQGPFPSTIFTLLSSFLFRLN